MGTAKITYLHIPEYLDTVTFHCQQAVEKYLKSYLIFQSTTFRLSHDLIYLLDLITEKDSDFKTYYDSVSELQGYAVEIRYPISFQWESRKSYIDCEKCKRFCNWKDKHHDWL